MVNLEKNTLIYKEAEQLMVGGGCAGGRKHRLLGQPVYMDHADGSKLYSVDGNEFIDYYCCAGAALYGHNNPRIRKGIEKAMENGFFMNFDSKYTLEYAKLFNQLIPSVEKMRFTNSGTEATLAAIRVARGYTGRKLVLKMDGHFHGMHELVWYNHGKFPEIDEFGEVINTVPDTAGVPEEFASVVKVIRFNDIEAVENAVKKYKDQIACLILEPISYNCGCYESTKAYLKRVREICTREGIVLIFDEVITGLRFAPGSAQTYYDIKPDLSTFAKAISGGLPLAIVGGKKEIMDCFNPNGPVVCSGTCSATQIAIVGGIECLKMVMEKGFYEEIERKAKRIFDGLNEMFARYGVNAHVRGVGAQFGIYFGYDNPEIDYDLRKTIELYDIKKGKEFMRKCLDNGIYFHFYGDSPYPHHCGFTSAHTDFDIDFTLERMENIIKEIR